MSNLRGGQYGRFPPPTYPLPVFSNGDIVVLPNGFLGRVKVAVREANWVYKVWAPRFDMVVMANENQLAKADAVTRLAWLGAHGA